ncbi:MAG: VRR-NUC domain-containing protein, partial [Thermoleophilaceae bacterium]
MKVELPELFPDLVAMNDTETRMLRGLLEASRHRGWLTYHAFDHRLRCRNCGESQPIPPRGRGFPDLVMAKAPRLVVRELKTQSGRVSPEQRRWIDELRNCGVDADVARPADLVALYDV